MKTDATCKLCGCSLTLAIDPDYAGAGDVYKLIQLATCNRCYDMRTKRERYHEELNRKCATLIALGTGKKSEEARETKKTGLTMLCRKYARLLCDYEKSNLVVPVEELVEELMNQPRDWQGVMLVFRKQVRAAVRQDRARQPEMPHND